MRIFEFHAPCADAINKIINTYMPYELSAILRHYQHYQESQYSIMKTMDALDRKYQKYEVAAQKKMERLKEANFLGRLMAYDDDIIADLEGLPGLVIYNAAMRNFNGPITQSALDCKPNPWHTNHRLPKHLQH